MWWSSRCRPYANAARTLPNLTRYFLQKHGPSLGNAEPSIQPEGDRSFLREQPWPGNVRQLENVTRKGAVAGAELYRRPWNIRVPPWTKPRRWNFRRSSAFGEYVDDLLAAARRGRIGRRGHARTHGRSGARIIRARHCSSRRESKPRPRAGSVSLARHDESQAGAIRTAREA